MEPMNNCRPSYRRVLMTFFLCDGFQVSFLEQDCKTTLPRHLTFRDRGAKILEMHDHWGAHRAKLASRRDLERDITSGRPGSTWLILTAEEYAVLLKPSHQPTQRRHR
jgi:hypothetical protein